MPDPYIDVGGLKEGLATFFAEQKADLGRFGSTVNQTFEAYVFASTVSWYRKAGWRVDLIHPHDAHGKRRTSCHLKFSTNGAPINYSYARCKKSNVRVHIRHQLRVATAFYKNTNRYPANICLDVAVIEDTDVTFYTTKTAVPNDRLVTFGEAKHMSAFAELVAGFIGMVHELQPARLTAGPHKKTPHPKPYLHVSGWLNGTALGLHETIDQRGFDLAIYTIDKTLASTIPIKVTPKKRKPKQAKLQTAGAGVPRSSSGGS